jgi:hypothetical protein
MTRFLIQSWVFPFYRTYSGFLFVVFLLAAGLLKGEEHVAIARFFTSNVLNLIYPYIGLLAYEVLTLRFSVAWVSHHRNRILQDLLFVRIKLRMRYLIIVILYLLVPVILYSLFLITIALSTYNYVTGLIILIFTLLRIFIYSHFLNRYIISPIEKGYQRLIHLSIPDYLNFPVILFSLRHFFSKNLLSLLLSKLLSIGLLFIFILLIDTIDYYNRFLAVILPLTFISNAFISYVLFRFLNIELNVFRNLPLRPANILLQVLFVLIILCLPEIIIIYRNFFDIIDTGTLSIHLINALSILLFLYASLVYFNFDLQKFIIRLFWGGIFIVMILLFDFPAAIMCIIFSALSVYLYSKGYYTFETVFGQKN